MLTTDQLLVNLVDNNFISQSEKIPDQDKKILVSLRQQLKKHVFLTEKQGNLLIKLLQTNKKHLQELTTEDVYVINVPFWSQEFRIHFPIRKVYFYDQTHQTIVIEFSYDKELRKKLNEEFNHYLSKRVVSTTSNKIVIVSNEYSIYRLIELIAEDNFEIESVIIELYNKIKQAIEENSDYLNILHNKNKKLYNLATNDLDEQDNTDLFLLDRRIKYQYDYESINLNNTLDYKIARRKDNQVYINAKNYDFLEIMEVIRKLKRFPLLLVFDERDPVECIKLLDQIKKYLDNKFIENRTGIYFRFNSNISKSFNQKVAEYNFNQYLDEQTTIVGISLKQLPKFLLRSNWYPRAVISNASNFRHSKVFTYCNEVDLIISYSSLEPLTRNMYAIM